eukprot:357308-Chlamydomonas_euryale.AAC.2
MMFVLPHASCKTCPASPQTGSCRRGHVTCIATDPPRTCALFLVVLAALDWWCKAAERGATSASLGLPLSYRRNPSRTGPVSGYLTLPDLYTQIASPGCKFDDPSGLVAVWPAERASGIASLGPAARAHRSCAPGMHVVCHPADMQAHDLGAVTGHAKKMANNLLVPKRTDSRPGRCRRHESWTALLPAGAARHGRPRPRPHPAAPVLPQGS